MYIFYNPNPSGLFTDDCTVRAICKALDRDWSDVYFSNGMTNMFRAFDIKEKMPKYQVNLMGDSLNDFATKEDMQKLTNEVKDLKKFLDELTSTSVKG